MCAIVPNFIKIDQTVAEIWRFNCFQNGGRPIFVIFQDGGRRTFGF